MQTALPQQQMATKTLTTRAVTGASKNGVSRRKGANGGRSAISKERRDEIIEASIRVFNRNGFRGATLDDVANEIGISKSLIYYHFKNKFEILAEVYRGMGVIFFEVLRPILEDETIPHVERLRLAIRAHVTTAIQNKSVFEIYFRERHEIPKQVQEKLITRSDRIYVTKLMELLEDGARLGVFQVPEPRVAAFSIIGACNWITFWYRPGRGGGGSPRLEPEEIAASVFETVGSGLIRRPA